MKFILSLIILQLLITACSPYNAEQHQLEQQKAKWESQHIIHYKMSVDKDDDGIMGPVTVEVKDGDVVSIVDAHGNVLFPNDDTNSSYDFQHSYTVESFFSNLARYY